MSDLKFWNPGAEVTNVNVKGLMGSKLTYLTDGGTKVSVVVAGADHYVGISLAIADDPSQHTLCLHGPLDPNHRERFLLLPKFRDQYPTFFRVFVDKLREALDGDGVFKEEEYFSALRNQFEGVGCDSNGVCPYGV